MLKSWLLLIEIVLLAQTQSSQGDFSRLYYTGLLRHSHLIRKTVGLTHITTEEISTTLFSLLTMKTQLQTHHKQPL